jgi:hypothetical protein
MVRQATKCLLCIALWSVAGCARESANRTAATQSGSEAPVVRVHVHDSVRYLVIELSGGRSYAVRADASEGEIIRPCECDLKECKPMCGQSSIDAGQPTPSDAGPAGP